MTGAVATGPGLVRLDAYDRTAVLHENERMFFSAELSRRIKFSRTRQPDLAGVRRLIQPLDDVFDHIAFRGPKRKALALFLLEEMDRRQKSFWGWNDPAWVELANSRRCDSNRLIAVAYLLCGFQSFSAFDKRRQTLFRLAERVVGTERFAGMIKEVQSGLLSLGYKARTTRLVGVTIAQVLLRARATSLDDLTREQLLSVQGQAVNGTVEKCLIAVSRYLAAQAVIDSPLSRVGRARYLDDSHALTADVPTEWARLARYWHDTSTLSSGVRVRHYYRLLCVGRWLRTAHADVKGPSDWTRATAAEAVAMLSTQTSGQWSHVRTGRIRNFGRVLAPSTRIQGMTTLRTFFQDLQQWEVIPARFEPYRAFRAPRSLASLVQSDPRVLADDVWAKLVWAGMNLTSEDLCGQSCQLQSKNPQCSG